MIKRIFFLFLAFISASSAFQFAWISDTHIGSEKGSFCLEQVVIDINNLENIDFVIVSGDITESDMSGHLLEAKKIFDKISVPYYVIPGNHELKWSNSGGTAFHQIFGSTGFYFEKEDIAFCGIHQGPILKMGYGFFYPQDLMRIKQLKEKMNNKKVIWVTHYPIDSSVTNYQDFLSLAKDINSVAVLHGHGHRYRISDYNGLPGIMCRSTLSDKDKISGYAVVNVTEDQMVFYQKEIGEKAEFWHQVLLKRAEIMIHKKTVEESVDLIWKYQEPDGIISSPALNRDKVCFVTYGGTVVFLDLKTGKKLWKKEIGSSVVAPPFLCDDRIMIPACDSNIYALSAEDGVVIWKRKLDSP